MEREREGRGRGGFAGTPGGPNLGPCLATPRPTARRIPFSDTRHSVSPPRAFHTRYPLGPARCAAHARARASRPPGLPSPFIPPDLVTHRPPTRSVPLYWPLSQRSWSLATILSYTHILACTPLPHHFPVASCSSAAVRAQFCKCTDAAAHAPTAQLSEATSQTAEQA